MENNHLRTLILVSLAWLLIFVGRLTPSVLLVQITDELHMSDFQAGLALSGIWFFYGILQFPSGVFADALGRKKIIVFSLIGFSVASILTGFSNSFLIAGITFCLIGMASGLLPSPSFTLIAELFGSKKGKALGIHSSIGSISGFIPIILPIIAVLFGWRNIFFLWGIIGFILAYSILIFADESLKNPEHISYTTRLKEMFKSISNRDILFMFFVNVAISIVWMGVLSWFPSYIQQEKGFGPEIAGVLFSIVLSGGLILKPVIGHISDKTNRWMILTILIFITSLSVFLLPISSSLPLLIIVSILFSQTAAFYPVRTSYLMDIWPSSTAAANLGVFRSMIILIGSPISTIMGWARENYGFDIVIYILAFSLLLTGLIMLFKIRKIR